MGESVTEPHSYATSQLLPNYFPITSSLLHNKRSSRIVSIPLKNIPRIYLLHHIIQHGIIPIGNNGIALGLEGG